MREAIALGFTSVMFDGGDLTLRTNVTGRTAALREARPRAGTCASRRRWARCPAPTDRGLAVGPQQLTRPEDAARFVTATGVDSLAIALGSVHAVRQKSMAIDLDRLRAIRAAVDVPLVLHGSSGVTDDHCRQGIALGLCKVNVATQLNQAFTAGVRRVLADAGEIDPRRYLGPARDGDGGAGAGADSVLRGGAGRHGHDPLRESQRGDRQDGHRARVPPRTRSTARSGCSRSPAARAATWPARSRCWAKSPVVTGWVGGCAGQFIETGLRAEGIGTAFVQTPFESRTCLSILDPDGQTLTELYEKGDGVPAEQVDAFVRWFGESVGAVRGGDAVRQPPARRPRGPVRPADGVRARGRRASHAGQRRRGAAGWGSRPRRSSSSRTRRSSPG